MAKSFHNLVGLPGFSEQLIRNHIALYEGYVANTVKVADALKKLLAEGKTATPEYAELSRRLGWEWNGMRLHELYFGNLGAKPMNAKSRLLTKIAEDFGTFDNWEKAFRATGAMRGIGWVILYYDPLDKKLFNAWINEHDVGHMAGAIPLLVMDVFEHAFMIDYGLKRADYIEAFFKQINWEEVEFRFRP